MRITEVETLILRRPDVLDNGDSSQDMLVVRLHTDTGLIGLGEADTQPEVGRAVIEAPLSFEVCKGLRPVVLGRDPFDRGAIWRDMLRASLFYGRSGAAVQAMSAIDLALWDLAGLATGLPVYKLLGGAVQARVRAYASVLMPETPAETGDLVSSLRAEGFGAVKLGWGGLGRGLAQDTALVRAAREAGGDMAVMIDMGNNAWDLDFRTMEILARMLADQGVYWLEEPFAPDAYESYARLRVPGLRIAAGEEECSISGFERLLGTGGVDVIQPDPSRAGGLTAALRVAERAESLGIALAPHAWSSPIVRAAALHLCAAMPHALMLEFSQHPTPLEALFETGLRLDDGFVAPADRPGFGVRFDLEAAKRFLV
jgi:L-rhamnonate dehydratase